MLMFFSYKKQIPKRAPFFSRATAKQIVGKFWNHLKTLDITTKCGIEYAAADDDDVTVMVMVIVVVVVVVIMSLRSVHCVGMQFFAHIIASIVV